MLGKDFFVYWQIGRAIIAGLDPYSVPESLYPPATLALFILLSVPPFTIAYALWTGINAALLFKSVSVLTQTADRSKYLWILFPPALFILMTGQMDILLLSASLLLPKRGYQSALGMCLITLKPQIAFIVLPWYVFNWIKTDSRTLLKALALTAIVHAIPLVINPMLYPNWIASVQSQSAWRLAASPGIFALTDIGVPWMLIAPFAIAIMIWGLRKSYHTSVTSQLFGLPMGLWYEGVFLVSAAPLKLLLPTGWISFIAAAILKTSWPLALTPLVVLAWRFRVELLKDRMQAQT